MAIEKFEVENNDGKTNVLRNLETRCSGIGNKNLDRPKEGYFEFLFYWKKWDMKEYCEENAKKDKIK